MRKQRGHSFIIGLILLSMTVVCCCGFDALLQMVFDDSIVCVSASEKLSGDENCGKHDDHLTDSQISSSRQGATAALCLATPCNLVLWTAPVLPAPRHLSWDFRLRLSSPPSERITPLLF